MATATASRRARRDRTGREQRRRSATARARRPDLTKFYARKLPPITPGDFEFSLDMPRKGLKALPLDPLVELFEWSEEGAAMAGSVQFRRPALDDPDGVPVTRGSLIRCRVKWQGRWYELWTMRVERPEVHVEDGTVSVSLVDDLAIARRGRRRYVWRTTKKRRHGWFAHELLRMAAKKDGIKLGSIAKGTRRITKLDMHGSFLDLAVKLYRQERDETGRHFIVRIRNGRFEVVPYMRNKILYVLAKQITSAVIAFEPKVENPATVWTGIARIGKGRRSRAVRHTEANRAVVEKLGYAHRTKNYGRLSSAAELKSKVKRDLARQLRVNTNVTLQFPGIPFIRRGDGAQFVLPSEGFEGDASFVYVTRIHHQVQSGGGYLTDADFTVKDPFIADRERREREARARKRKAREGETDGWRVVGASVFTDAVGYRGDNLAGRMSFAELGMGHNLGGLAYKTLADFEYNGTIVRGILLDIGDGGDPVEGHRRDADLHIELAAALGAPTDDVFLVRMRIVGQG